MMNTIRANHDTERTRDIAFRMQVFAALAAAAATFAAGVASAANSAVSDGVALTARPFASGASSGGALYSTEHLGTIIMLR